MLKQILTLALRLWHLTEDTARNKTEIKEVRQQLNALTDAVQALAYELRRVAEHEQHERERLALRLENELLRFERRLPAAKKG